MARSLEPPCTPRALEKAARTLGFSLTAPELETLAGYLNLLEKWNKAMNLVGPGSWRDIFDRLIVDSLYLAGMLRELPLPPAPVSRDLGAGAGLPGIPLRVLWRDGRYTLVEAREKRALFLKTVLASLPLPGVEVFQGRAEAFMAARPPADLTVSRAFMPWRGVLALVEPHTEEGGFCVFLTLEPLPLDLPEGWRAVGERAYAVGGDTRYFWALQKRASTSPNRRIKRPASASSQSGPAASSASRPPSPLATAPV